MKPANYYEYYKYPTFLGTGDASRIRRMSKNIFRHKPVLIGKRYLTWIDKPVVYDIYHIRNGNERLLLYYADRVLPFGTLQPLYCTLTWGTHCSIASMEECVLYKDALEIVPKSMKKSLPRFTAESVRYYISNDVNWWIITLSPSIGL